MQISIQDKPIQFQLFGLLAEGVNKQFAQVGMRLMNELWGVIKEKQIQTTGINHWVYFDDDRMFVGIALADVATEEPKTDSLSSLNITLERYAKYLHVGEYSKLPEVWRELLGQLASMNERVSHPSLEVYGHECESPEEAETTILIGLEPKD